MNKGSWKKEEEEFVLQNINKLSLKEMTKHIDRSENAIKLFLHRNKISIGESVKRNLVKELLTQKFIRPEYFNPNREFYHAVGITQMRWWDLYYGRKQITEKEYISLAEHFNLSLKEAFESRQLNLFTEDDNK